MYSRSQPWPPRRKCCARSSFLAGKTLPGHCEVVCCGCCQGQSQSQSNEETLNLVTALQNDLHSSEFRESSDNEFEQATDLVTILT